ncbi:MAG: Cobalt-zinc-cadmium resistance protein CzcB [Planctomycetota bacterium]
MSTAVPREPLPASGHPSADSGPQGRGQTRPQRRPFRLPRGLAGVGFLLAGAAAWWWLSTHHFTGQSTHDGEATKSRDTTDRAGAGPAGRQPTEAIVVLPEAARAAAGIELATVEPRLMRDQLTVPGRIDYDSRRRLDYASPVDGIVSRVFVQVRQKVAKGDPLAELSSPDVGAARDEVRRREDDRRIEQKAADWATTIADNVEALLDTLASHPPLADVEKQFEQRVLGSYREKILGSYSRLIYVEKVSAGTKSLGEGGVLSGRIVEERASNLEVAKANFIAACEEARFLTRQDRDRARATLEQADRLVQISRENLRTLVGSRLEASPDADETESPGETGSLSSLVLRTPFDGIVEDVFVTRGERARVGDRMFVVADTSMLWVRAQIHERQWTAVEVGEGQSVRVVVPGADTHEATAVVNHVGATVEAESRSVPLVAELTNDDAHFKPGMFVWVDLPQGKPRDALAVPAAAVMRHEGKAFVFVPEGEAAPTRPGDTRFRRVGVTTGISDGDAVEVTGGLAAGDRVVARGAFVLKSELLLEQEAE